MSEESDKQETQESSGLASIFSMHQKGARPKHWKRHLVIQLYPFVLLVVDLLLLALIFGGMVALRYDVPIFEALSRRVLLAIGLPSLLGLYLVGGYNYATDKSKYRFFSEYLIAAVAVAVVAVGLIYAVVAYGVPLQSARSIVAGTLVLFPLAALAYRVVLNRFQRRFECDNVICIIGAGKRAVDVYKRLRASNTGHNYIVLGFDQDTLGEKLVPECDQSPVVESFELLDGHSPIHGKYVESYVVACEMDQLPDEVSEKLVVAFFKGNRVFSYENYLEFQFRMIPPSQLSVSWPLQEGFRLSRSVAYDRMKRMSDIGAALVGLVVASPVMLVTALAVKLTSAGPIIFKQARTGHHEKTITIYKFRSMTVGSEKGNKYTSPGDARITPVGNFLRKTRLDELPQLWNVLKGDLSLIGPRAEWVDLVKRYEQIFPYYHFRHAVKPGITGWAQVNYSYGASEEDTLEKLYFDLYYVRRYSLALDVAIVIKTVYMMVFGRGQ